jgi:hypothetical protein
MGEMDGFVRVDVIAERWNVSERQVQALCKGRKICGAFKFGNTWAIPYDAQKPTRTGEYKPGRKPRE